MVCAIGSREQHNVRALFSATHCFFWRRLLQTWEAFSVLSDQVGRLCLLHISTRLLTGPLYTTFGMASIFGGVIVGGIASSYNIFVTIISLTVFFTLFIMANILFYIYFVGRRIEKKLESINQPIMQRVKNTHQP